MKTKSGLQKALCLALCLGISVAGGCVTYKNPASSVPPAAMNRQWQVRYPIHLCVRNPQESEFESIPESGLRKWELDQAKAEAQRLVIILNECRLFNKVTLSSTGETVCDLTIEAQRQVLERSLFDCSENPYVIVYGTLIPLYFENNMGIAFKFLNGADGNFKFNWTEKVVVGFWAPVVGGLGTDWQFKHVPDQYWHDLRSSLIQEFDQIYPQQSH